MSKLSIRDLQPAGKRVLVRVDFNVPLKDGDDGARIITDDTRIQGAIPTIKHLVDAGAKVILMSHLGRPKGEREPKCSLAPVAAALGDIFPGKVSFVEDCVGEVVTDAATQLADGEILLLENLRYHAAETANDADFSAQLASLADIYVNDAFGTAHRAHASTAGVAAHLPQAAMGFLLEKELEYLVGKLKDPARPFLVIMGGAKVSDKIEVITALLDKADAFLIGGAMAYTFRLAQGYEVGDSLVEVDKTDLALDILKKAEEKGVRFLLPADNRTTKEFKDDAETEVTAAFADGGRIAPGSEGIDIGPIAISEFCDEIAKAGTILWNGPLGVFEKTSFAEGTRAISAAVAKSDALTIIGGGDSVTAVRKFGVAEDMTFISTGGGASLELLEGNDLPGFAALTDLA